MSFRTLIDRLRSQDSLLEVDTRISKTYQIAGLLKGIEPGSALFTHVSESPFRVAGNLLCSKAAFADYFGIPVSEIIPLLSKAIESPAPCQVVKDAPCQKVVITDPDLDSLPILRHCAEDGGNYISSGVFVTRHPTYGQNLDFHRCMQFSKNEMAVRVVKGRHFDLFLQDLKQVDVAVCVGVSPAVLVAAASSVELGVDELQIANALEPLVLGTRQNGGCVLPPNASSSWKARSIWTAATPKVRSSTLPRLTMWCARSQCCRSKRSPTARMPSGMPCCPGGLEHKLLMGMPREPTIFRKVNQVVRCLDVNVNPGGCSWLHAIVQIEKRHEDDGLKAIAAAFDGHRSCKHVFVVDADIDIYDPLSVEWAMATRFQGDRGLVLKERSPGSSLDPSAEPETHRTTRLGFDLTRPLKAPGKDFSRARFPDVDVSQFIIHPSKPMDQDSLFGSKVKKSVFIR